MADSGKVKVWLTDGLRKLQIEGQRVAFNPWQCFRFDGSPDEEPLFAALGQALLGYPRLVVYGDPHFIAALTQAVPTLAAHAMAIIEGQASPTGDVLPEGLALDALAVIPADAATVFHAEVSAFRLQQLRARLAGRATVLGPELLLEIVRDLLPTRAWTPVQYNIYPIPIPDIEIEPGLDILLTDCPARNLALMPNGLGYVHNALKRAHVRFQTFDLDIVSYHRFHIHRLFDLGGTVILPNGRELPIDPWQAEHYDLWEESAVIEYFKAYIEEAAVAIAAARPKVLGLSIHSCNAAASRLLVSRIKELAPETIILVGGFACYSGDIGLRAFPEADYMCIGEADLTVGPLVQALARGDRPRDLPGVLSHNDTPDRRFAPAPMPHDLDKIDFPRYEWFNLSIYRNFNGYQLTPIIASRGCRWSRCTFCAERFYWRIRSPRNFCDELEWLEREGCGVFMFNESDLNGIPEKLLDICDEIIRRGIKVRLTGQLRVNKKSDRAFYQKLHEAGFVALRFGVDAFSENTLRLQKKGYTTEMASQNLKDCWEAGIYTEVNWVIGVPGETDADIEESVDLILQNRSYIGRLANINPLILANGSVYWIDPEEYGIQFRKPREELYANHFRAIPAEDWYSVEPFIDAQVRKRRFARIVERLMVADFPIGSWAQRIIAAVESGNDAARGGGSTASEKEPQPGTEVAPAELIRTTDSHRLYRHGNRYLGVPLALGEVDVTTLENGQDGVVCADSEAEALIAIELAADWANSRGHYDPRKRQRHFGSDMRAGSFLGESERAAALNHPLVFPHKGRWIAISADHLAEAENAPAPRASLLRRWWALLPIEVHARYSAAMGKQAMAAGRARMIDRLRILAQPAMMLPVLKSSLGIGRLMLVSTARRAANAARQRLGRKQSAREWRVASSTVVDAVPELIRVIGNYNLVHYDGVYYGLPHGVPVDWTSGMVDTLRGVIIGGSARAVSDRIEQVLGRVATKEIGVTAQSSGPAIDITRVPIRVGSLNGYQIVTYEGWIYGLPEDMANIDLREIDVIEHPEVIRDVSHDVVEQLIRERTRALA